ncbi:MAG: 5-(carboxyamino)imidazole ribonucleotide mutase [bacterium]
MEKNQQAVVAIVIGSHHDYEVMKEAQKLLDDFGVPNEVMVCSAHRTPADAQAFAQGAAVRGIKVIIAGAGKAAHLPGVIAAWTTLPVIGVPLDAGMFGIDALLSIVQMPAGVPVACMAVGKSGAINAALCAVAILALTDAELTERLMRFREKQAAEVRAKSEELRRR